MAGVSAYQLGVLVVRNLEFEKVNHAKVFDNFAFDSSGDNFCIMFKGATHG